MNKVTTDDIFGDIGCPPEEAADLNRRSLLLMELQSIVKRKKLTTSAAAKRFGVDNSVAKRVKEGDIDFFTVELMIPMLERAGKQVQLVIVDKKRTSAA